MSVTNTCGDPPTAMNAKPTLILSLMLNVGLVGAVAYLASARSTSTAQIAATAGSPSAGGAKAADASKTRPTHVTNLVFKSFNWQTVESPDYKEYIANLRSIGCPEETIRDIIIADVNKLFEDRKKALKKPEKAFKFWETGMSGMMGGMMDPEAIAAQQALAAEKKALIRQLLGIDYEDKVNIMAAFNPFERMLDFLPAGKQNQIMEIYQQMQAKQVEAFKGGTPDEVDMKKMQEAQKDLEKQIAGILTPEEFEKYQLTLSQTAMTMRMTMDGFEPSEQEFREIFKVQKAFDDQYGLMGMGLGGDAEGQKKRSEAEAARQEQMKSILGDQRYADYQRETDFQFKALSKVADRQGLPKESAVQVWDMKKVAEQEANRVRSDSSLNPQQRQAALQAVRAETERSISKVLGDDGFGSYKKQNGAWWLNGISQESSTKVPAVQTTIIANP
jgi:tetratricopeptide (TPR) repeat protein